MSPFTSPPSPELLADLMGEHARRYPEKATVDVIGDGGALLRLPLIIGIPSGTVGADKERPAFPAWANLCASTLGARKVTGLTAELVRDCLIYPGRGLLAQWEDRWPAIVDSLGVVVLQKIGADGTLVRAPSPAAKPPESIAAALAASPASTWREVLIGGDPLPVVITPPSRAHWEALTTAIRDENCDAVALLTELVNVCCKGEGLGTRLQRWPGLALPLENVVVRLAGANADARLGEW